MDLGSLNIENIENILTSMSSEEFEQLKNTATSLFSSFDQEKDNSDKKEKSKNKSGASSASDFNIDFETITRIMSLMERINNQPEDPRCTFLRSLKPMLSSERKLKVDQAVKMLSVMSFLPIIQELGGNSNV